MNDPIQDINDTSTVIHQLFAEHLPAEVSPLERQALTLGVRLTLTHLVKRVTFDDGVTGRSESRKQDELVAQLREELRVAREELSLADKLLDARNAVLSLIPDCEAHGAQCLPNAQAWIERALLACSPDLDFKEGDLNISSLSGPGIQVTHTATGFTAQSRHGRTQFANKGIALRAIQNMLKTEGIK